MISYYYLDLLTDNDCEYLTARVLYTHTPLPVRSITFMHTGVSYREGCLYDTVGKTMVGAVQITPAPAAPPAVASGPAITSVAAIEAGIYIYIMLSGLCLCKGEAKIGPD